MMLRHRLRAPRLMHRPLALELFEARQLLAAQPILAEVVASNRDSLVDGYGNSEDWIEIQNVGDQAVQLGGYFLTDDVNRLTRWAIPAATELPAGGFLVIFASGRNERDPKGHLHTNFRLDSDGESVSLVAPDTTTIVSQLTYESLPTDVGFGVEQVENIVTWVQEPTTGRFHVVQPSDEATLGRRWTGGNEPFDDSSWTSVQTPVGFGAGNADSNVNIARGKTVTASGPLWAGFDAARITDGSRSTFTHPLTPVTTFSFIIDLGEEQALDRIDVFNRNDGCCPDRLTNYEVTLHDDDEGSLGPAVWTGRVRTNGTNSGSGGRDRLLADVDPQGDFSGRYIKITKIDDGSQNYWPQIAEVEAFAAQGYDQLVKTNVSDSMLGKSSSALLRFPFNVDDPTKYQNVELQIKYDDGFVAYLNGTEVSRRNAPAGQLPLLSQATDIHSGTSTESIALNSASLRAGNNVLAIQLLNRTAQDDDLFLSPKLVGRSTQSNSVGYLLHPTPGAVNGERVVGFVDPVAFSVARGFFAQPFVTQLTATTPGSTLIYTTDGSTPSRTNGTQVVPAGPNATAQATVSVNTTTNVRALAIREEYGDAPVITQSYLFLSDVLQQPNNPPGMPTTWAGTPADYQMDPDVVTDPAYRDEMVSALRSIPTMSIVTDHENLWDANSGIYINSTQRGPAWERPISIELILPDGSTGFQTNAGLRMWGTGWAPHSSSKKHAFQLKFKDIYGPTKLEYPLFADAPVEEFDDIVLRAQGSRSWNDFRQPDINQTQYLRDAWARDTAHEMGKLEGHATFVHLYLNGLYWGLYNPVERTNEQFAEEYVGGDAEEYDVINRRSGEATHATSGNMDAWNAMFAIANGGLQSSQAYEAIQKYLNVDDFIDYMLLQQYATNHDGPDQGGNNMRAFRRRTEDGRFTFHVWDMEYTLWYHDEHRNIDGDVPDSPMRLFLKLRENADFRMRFADRAKMHLTNGGALTPERAAARYQMRSNEIFSAILGESARWGDARRATRPYTRDVEWIAERDRLMNEYFPQRTAVLIDQLRDAGLFPDIEAPVMTPQEGQVLVGSELHLTTNTGTVYYTLDGTDPRLPGGAISPTAQSLVPTTRLIDPQASRLDVAVPVDGSLSSSWMLPETVTNPAIWKAGQGAIGYTTQPSSEPVAVPLQNATATFSQLNRSVATLIDGDPAGRGWGLSQPVDFQGPIIRAATAVFETVQDISFDSGTELTFTIVHNVTNRNNLGRFRLSVTTDSRDTFADGKDSAGDVTANWIPLHPTAASSLEGSNFTIDADGSLLVSGGTNSRDTYTIKASTGLQKITGIRLETLNDRTLPGRAGPGRGAGGAAIVSEFTVQAAPITPTQNLDANLASVLSGAMAGKQASAYVRIPFQVASPDAFAGLKLRVRYTDGFVAYLNGQPVARVGVAGNTPPAFNAVASVNRSLSDAWEFVELDLDAARSLLKPGDNLLALQAMNASTQESTWLLQTELLGTRSLASNLTKSAHVKARTQTGEGWSALTERAFETFGDFDANQKVDTRDLDLLCAAVQVGDATYDITDDEKTDIEDVRLLVLARWNSTFGDANLDGRFNSTDLVQIFQRGEYEDAVFKNSKWDSGDWNCDGDFTTGDLVLAFQAGGYVE